MKSFAHLIIHLIENLFITNVFMKYIKVEPMTCHCT
jgi:hypothetical protein